mgnify:FL=1|jgi:exodeoxyribonuclease VII small subunit
MVGKTPAKSSKTLNFEAALDELEKVVADMETGQLSLEDSLAAYKRGAELLQICRGRLQDVQQQVQVLEEGALKVFTANETSDTDGQDSHPRRNNG